MKYPILLLPLLVLGTLASCGGCSEEADASAPDSANTAKAPSFDDQRSPAEVVTPFAIPEEERTCASPYRPDVTLDMPLVAAGKEISPLEVQRHLCLGFGYSYSEYAKFQVLIDQELARRKQAGEDISKYVVDDAALDKHIAQQRADFALRYPTLDFAVEVGRAYINFDIYREPARQSMVFDRLFLPDDPAEWPDMTTELIRQFAGDQGQNFIDDAFTSYKARKQKMIDENLDELPREDPILVSTYKDIILRGLQDYAQIETNPERLPPDVLMTVEGVQIPISKVWNMIAPYVTPMDIDMVRRFLVLCKVMEADLASKGVLLSQDEFEKSWPEEEGLTYRKKLEQYQMMAQQEIGFQSLEGLALYFRLTESLRKELGDQLEDDAFLTKWSTITNEVTGASKREVEMILSSAWNGDLAAWVPGGWETARRKSHELKGELDNGAEWRPLRELNSDFWDPPMPEIGNTPIFSLRSKGAFGQQTRNQLMALLEEGEGWEFLYGKTITDQVFYEQEVGTTAGPLMGVKGYYITRLTGRTPPLRPLDLTKPLHRKLIQNFFLRVELNKRAHELVQKGVEDGTVRGI